MFRYGLLAGLGVIASIHVIAQTSRQPFVIEHEGQVAREEPGPHRGGGMSVGYSFFSDIGDYPMAFKKRVLKPGAAIGYHLQGEDEIYYVLSGEGLMKMNGETFVVKAGDAILTRPGSSHGLTQTGDQDLVLIILYEK